jgi:hypothetical protein
MILISVKILIIYLVRLNSFSTPRLINKAARCEDTWGSGGIAPPFLTSALDGGGWSASRPCRFTPEERVPSIH